MDKSREIKNQVHLLHASSRGGGPASPKMASRGGQAHPSRERRRLGQAILLVVLVIGGTMLGATTIAGFLTSIQLQQVTDVQNSAKAIFAADAGVNCARYLFDHPNYPADMTCFSVTNNDNTGRINFLNRAFVEVGCYEDDSFNPPIPCNNERSLYILSKGTSGTTKRAFLYTILPSNP